MEPIAGGPGRGFAIRGLAELLALPGGDLLALEREFVAGRGFKIQLYRVSAPEGSGVTDVSGWDSLAGKTWTPVRKTLVFDFARAGFPPDNLEGMAFGPDLPDGSRTLVLVSDNNFELLEQTQLVALRVLSLDDGRFDLEHPAPGVAGGSRGGRGRGRSPGPRRGSRRSRCRPIARSGAGGR